MSQSEVVHDFVADGFDWKYWLREGAGRLKLVHWPAGVIDDREHFGFEHEHRVTQPDGSVDVLLVAPMLDKHDVTVPGDVVRTTVTPSVLCDCGLHGFITDGAWRSV